MARRSRARAREACARHHVEYVLIRGENPVQQRLFEVTGLLDALPWRETDAEPSGH